MKALLISNPNSTTQTPELFSAIIPKLRSVPGLHLRAQFTHYAGHARNMCQGLTRADYDIVIVVGGDGTINEVINGLLGNHDTVPHYADIPALALIPTGSANVCARALGFPSEPQQAVDVLVETLVANLRRRIDLGRWNEGWFAVNAGFGLDAEVIARMERVRRQGFAATPLRYMRLSLQALKTIDAHPPRIAVTATDAQGRVSKHRRMPLLMVSNTNPWTFFGPLPMVTNPRNSFDVGLSLFGIETFDGVVGLFAALQMFGMNLPSWLANWVSSSTYAFDDAFEIKIHCDRAHQFQIDGEYAGEYQDVHMRAVADAIEVFSPTKPVATTPRSILRLLFSFFSLRL
ncbi:diacylglycerol kinase family protein [Corynebacterium sp. HS2168-gen11]|uniref:diacylglycerol/lipid kinase family protein n=1 Tax=Corynebacterium sp. HS2168-gen11 TaxID=2974027 RepID=UPI00216B2C1F|nr:diacylglycerol kinase family protein [Corynebacterium sp. HS2168-gen11]MCS4536054.1 diacylglycerol kinase family lipid kinase [Corynebacterium sp. HS2168-gen11]